MFMFVDGSRSTVHRFHLYLCEHGTYYEIFNELLNKGYDLKKIDILHFFIDTKDIPAKKGEKSSMIVKKSKRGKILRVNEVKLKASVIE